MGAFDYGAGNSLRGGGVIPSGLLNGTSSMPVLATGLGNSLFATYPPSNAKVVLSGATTAATLKTILSLSGKGCISLLAVCGADITSRTHRMKVTLDGVVIFDATSAAITVIGNFCVPIGSLIPHSNYFTVIPENLLFNTSLLIEYAGSLSETNGASIAYRYAPR